MAQQVYCGIIIALTLVAVQQGNALKCWQCSSDLEPACLDHFNTTKLLQYRSNYQNAYNPQFQGGQRNEGPILNDCGGVGTLTQMYGQKAMCLKRVISEPSGRQRVSRECKILSNQQAAGRCPTEATGRGFSVDFCEYCEYDGCNTATTTRTNLLLATIIPLALLFFFRK